MMGLLCFWHSKGCGKVSEDRKCWFHRITVRGLNALCPALCFLSTAALQQSCQENWAEYFSTTISYAKVSASSLEKRNKTLYSGSLSFFLFLCGIDRNGDSLCRCTAALIRVTWSTNSSLLATLNSVFVLLSLKISNGAGGVVT
jgi:hypothetical protein